MKVAETADFVEELFAFTPDVRQANRIYTVVMGFSARVNRFELKIALPSFKYLNING